MSDLKRIEAKYRPDADGFAEIPPVLDFLKLARALDEIYQMSIGLAASGIVGHRVIVGRVAEVLNEVAGGSDD